MTARISHMESCLSCGSTTSSAVVSNETVEKFADRFIGLAVRSGDVKALHELAVDQLSQIGCFGYQTGSSTDGPSSLHKLRRIRIAIQALQAAKDMLEPIANDIHRFDSNGHLQ
jgi:hypothetical protein